MTTLQTGTEYFVSFYVSLSDSSGITTDNVGVFFSTDSLLSSDFFEISITPQIENPTGNYILDTSGWTQIKGSFIAIGGEKFITIGNFKGNAQTDTISAGGGTTFLHKSKGYFYIDDVCLSTDSTTCYLPNTINDNFQNNSFTLSPNPFTQSATLSFNQAAAEKYDFLLFDVFGREVMSVMNLRRNTTINRGNLASGVYFYRVVQEEKMVSSGKLIVQ